MKCGHCKQLATRIFHYCDDCLSIPMYHDRKTWGVCEKHHEMLRDTNCDPELSADEAVVYEIMDR